MIPLPEVFFAGGGNSHRGFGLNQAGPRDPDSGFPVGGTALFVNSEELRFPQVSLPYLGEGFGFAIFHDMGNVFTAGHDMLKGLLRWHQPDPVQCLPSSGVIESSLRDLLQQQRLRLHFSRGRAWVALQDTHRPLTLRLRVQFKSNRLFSGNRVFDVRADGARLF